MTAFSLGQQFERMGPLVFLESRNAPKHAKRFDSPSRDDGSTIKRLPSKLLDYLGHFGFCFRIVSANEHGWDALFVLRIDHSRGTTLLKAFTTYAPGIFA